MPEERKAEMVTPRRAAVLRAGSSIQPKDMVKKNEIAAKVPSSRLVKCAPKRLYTHSENNKEEPAPATKPSRDSKGDLSARQRPALRLPQTLSSETNKFRPLTPKLTTPRSTITSATSHVPISSSRVQSQKKIATTVHAPPPARSATPTRSARRPAAPSPVGAEKHTPAPENPRGSSDSAISTDMMKGSPDDDVTPSKFNRSSAPEPSTTTFAAPSSVVFHIPALPQVAPAYASAAPSPRLLELRKKLATAENKMSLRMQFLDAQFQGINTDMDSLTTRTEPEKRERVLPMAQSTSPRLRSPSSPAAPIVKVPMLSLKVAKTIVREETVEGAKAIDYMQDARMISERLLGQMSASMDD